MRASILRGCAAAGLALASAACIIVMDDPLGGESGVIREYHKIVPFDPNGELAVLHLDGDIEISGWERNEIEITAESESGGRRSGIFVRAEGRPEFEIEGKAKELRIRTRWDGDERRVYPVRLFLNVPRAIALRAVRTGRGGVRIADLFGPARIQIQTGDLKVENYSGALQATLDRGSVQAEILDIRKDDAISILTRTGDIALFLEPAAAVKLEARAGVDIASEFDLKTPAGAKSAAASLGPEPRASLSLQAPAGRIQIKKTR